MNDSAASNGTDARSYRFTHLFADKRGDDDELPHWVISFRMACLLSFPAWFILPTNSSVTGLLSTLAILLIVGYCSCYSCKLIVKTALPREESILDTITRLLGKGYRSFFLALGGIHFLAVGSLYFRETTYTNILNQ